MDSQSKDWTKETYSFDYLLDKAREWDWGIELTGDYENVTMIHFLKWTGVVPGSVEWKRKNSLPRTALDQKAIPAGYLAEVAYDWDSDGFSLAEDFVRALEFEVSGTSQNRMVSEVMEDLGRD